ncbi:MAG: hypothetical protein K8S24_00070 [Candidatus Aegiribacteria sp.]|nr:hypothetical protein [Candidatus Aegiribacteria sp.]
MRYGIIAALISSIVMTTSAWMSEEAILTRYSDMIFRPDSMTLCIVTTGGDTLVFADTPYSSRTDEFNVCVYSVISYLPEQNYWAVQIDGYEWQGWLIINGESGRINEAISEPWPDPGGTRLFCSMGDKIACYIENGIQIWRIDTDTLALEFEDLDVGWEPNAAEWISDSIIVFEKIYYDWRTNELTILPGRLELISDGNWTPEDPVSWE